MFDEKEIAYLQEMEERITHSMAVLIESDVTPKFNLLADGIKDIQEKLVPRSRMDDLEEFHLVLQIVHAGARAALPHGRFGGRGEIPQAHVPPNGGGYCKAEKGELNTRYSRTVPMFGIVIFYPAGQPIRNRSGAETCRMHGVPCCRISG